MKTWDWLTCLLVGVVLGVLSSLIYITWFTMPKVDGFSLSLIITLVGSNLILSLFTWTILLMLLRMRMADLAETTAYHGQQSGIPDVEYPGPAVPEPFPSTGFDFGSYNVNEPEEEGLK